MIPKSISYAITACNEYNELKRLLNQLKDVVTEFDEIIVQLDSNASEEMFQLMDEEYRELAITIFCSLNGDFASFKNNLKSYCTNEYIFFIDADEYLSEGLLNGISYVINNNDIDVFLVPRSNTVEGLTSDHIKKWGWRLDEYARVNWPDYQMRIVKNIPELKWVGKVHERIEGFKTISHFPIDNEDWCLHHPKTIERQEKQNAYYNTI